MKIQYIFLILGSLTLLLGTNMVFGARKFIKKAFPKGDINNATKGMKIIGVLVCVVGLMVTYFNINI